MGRAARRLWVLPGRQRCARVARRAARKLSRDWAGDARDDGGFDPLGRQGDGDDGAGAGADDWADWAGDLRSLDSDDDGGFDWARACEDDASEVGGAGGFDAADDSSSSGEDSWAHEWARHLGGAAPAAAPGRRAADGGAEVALAREVLGAAALVDDDDDDSEGEDGEDASEGEDGDDASEGSEGSEGGKAAPATCADFTIVRRKDLKKRRRQGPTSPNRGSIVRARADSKEEIRRQQRAAKFAADASRAPPPPPKRTFAHPGGVITSNKDEALAKYLARTGQTSP